ncbi:hypothetical protein N665_0121s0014 [Sinapis alba]|nr:hypothetical protein N665_0121s0014 [Sinapis alba]
MEHDTENRSAHATNSVEEADLVDKEKNPSKKEMDFRLVDFLPMRWTGTDFEFAEDIDPEKERSFSARKNQKWDNHLPTRSSFKSVRRLIFQTNPHSGFTFLIPASHQKPWAPPIGYACIYESWFNNCRLWWPLPEFLTTHCSRRKIAFGQYTANGIRIMVTLTVLAAELDIKMSVRLLEELTTPSITAKIGFFYGKMVPNGPQVQRDYREDVESEFREPVVFLQQVEAIRTLSHQHWHDISEAHTQAALNRIIRENGKTQPCLPSSYAASIGTPSHGQEGSSSGNRLAKRRRISQPDEGAPNVSPRPSPSPELPAREPLGDEVGSQDLSPRHDEEPSPSRNSPLEPVDETEMVMTTGEPKGEHLRDPSLEGELPEEELQGDELQGLDPASQGDEVVEYPHLIDFHYQHTEVPFVGDHEAPACLFHHIKLKTKGMPELDELSQHDRYRKMTRASAIFLGSVNLIVRDYEANIKTQGEKLAEKSRSLKKKKKENAELKGKLVNCWLKRTKPWRWSRSKNLVGELLSKELEEMKAQKEVLDSRLRMLEQDKIKADSKFEMTTKRLRESRENEVRKERLRVEAAMRQQVMPVYEKMRQYLEEQSVIRSKWVLYSQAKGARESLEKIQTLGMSMYEVLEQVGAGETRYSYKLSEMETIEASEINLQPIGLDEHVSNLKIFSPQDIEDLRHSD